MVVMYQAQLTAVSRPRLAYLGGITYSSTQHAMLEGGHLLDALLVALVPPLAPRLAPRSNVVLAAHLAQMPQRFTHPAMHGNKMPRDLRRLAEAMGCRPGPL